MIDYKNINANEGGLSVRAKINTMFADLISGEEGVNNVWGKLVEVTNGFNALELSVDDMNAELKGQVLKSFDYTDATVEDLRTYINGMNGGISGFAVDTSFNPNFPEDKAATVLAVGAGTYVNMLDVNGNPITIEDADALTVFYKGANSTYWQYKSVFARIVIDSVEGVEIHVSAQIKAQVTDKVGITIAPLGADSKVPSAYLPSYVDDIVEGYFYNNKFYTTFSHTQEIAGEVGKIYVDLSTNKTFRWSGTTFVEISKSLAIGTTAGTAYDGASGAKNASDIATLKTSVAGKVDKVDGKGLSTNDYTTAEKDKLANLSDSNADIVKNGGGITTPGTGLSKSGNTLNHTNAITAQTTSKFVALKVDAQGHITAIGDELIALTTTEITEILV